MTISYDSMLPAGLARAGSAWHPFWRTMSIAVLLLCTARPAAAVAPAMPLFAAQEPLAMELEFDFEGVCRNPTTGECQDLPATIRYTDEHGRHSLYVRLRTRGRWRPDSANCELPALFVYFREDQTDGTMFDGQTMLPLTTHCKRNDKDYHGYAVREYFAYRLYTLLTDASLGVRLVDIAYRDSGPDAHSGYRRYGFFSENFSTLAERLGGETAKLESLDPRDVDATTLAMLSVFQYAIGNLDWSAVGVHNVVFFRLDDGMLLPVPFDFDYAGLVDAAYASPPKFLNARSVRDRVYRGFCRPDIDWEQLFSRFLATREDAIGLIDGLPGLRRQERMDTMRFLRQSYDIIGSEKRRRRHIVEACRPMPDN